jgi:argininosuccinate lyase
MSQNFNFLSFPDTLITGSSIMPHKKNPDLFEILRAKCNKLKALPNEIMMITSNLITGYHRDLQLIKESFIPALFDIQACLKILHFALLHVQVRQDILKDKIYQSVFSVESINLLVEQGFPFREAYHKVAKEIEQGTFNPPEKIAYSHEGSIANLCNNCIVDEMRRVVNEFNFEKADKALEQLVEK